MDETNTKENAREATCSMIVSCALEVHRNLGPGLLESTYEKCLAYELIQAGAHVEVQKIVPIQYKELRIETGFRADLIVNDLVLVEMKALDALADVHKAQVITYLKLTGIPLGLLINFNVRLLKQGIKRVVHNLPPSPSLRA